MDNYKQLRKFGKQGFIDALEEIGWRDWELNDRAYFDKHFVKVGKYRYFYILSHYVNDSEWFEDDTDYRYKELWDKFFAEKLPNWKISHSLNERDVKVTLESPAGVASFDTEDGAWFEPEFLDVVNGLLEKENNPNRFYAIPPCDQWFNLIYLPKDLLERALAKGISPHKYDYFPC